MSIKESLKKAEKELIIHISTTQKDHSRIFFNSFQFFGRQMWIYLCSYNQIFGVSDYLS